MKHLVTLLGIIAGNAILAFAVTAFILPHQLIANGTAGFGLAINYYFHFPVVATVTVLNILMLILAFLFVGKRFALTAIISTFLYPMLLELFQRVVIFQSLTDNLMLSSIFAGVLSGLGVGLVLKVGASTGGFDIPPLILNKKFNFSIGATLYAIDTCIILSQVLFSNTEKVLYGILLVFLCSMTINKVLIMGTSRIQLLVISNFYIEIKQALLHNLDSGATLIKIETGFSKQENSAVLTVIPNRKLNDVKEAIQRIDDKAFIMVSSVTEVRGRGFSIGREIQ